MSIAQFHFHILGAKWEIEAQTFHDNYESLKNKIISDDEFLSMSVLPITRICEQVTALQNELKVTDTSGAIIAPRVLERDTIKYSVISILLDLLNDPKKDKKFKNACLKSVTEVTKASGSPSSIFKIFPGVSTAIFKICVGDFKQGKDITALSIDSWSQITSLVMNDSLQLNVTKEQFAEAKSKIKIMAGNIFSFKHGPPLLDNYCVRLALVRAAILLLDTCHKNLSECAEYFVDTVVLYNNIESDPNSSSISIDEEERDGGNEIVRLTEDAIERMGKKIHERKNADVNEDDVLSYLSSLEENAENVQKYEENKSGGEFSFAEERFYNLMSLLPRLNISTVSDEKKLDTIRLVNGYIKLLSGNLSSMIPVLLEKIAFTLISLLEFDTALPAELDIKTNVKSIKDKPRSGNVVLWRGLQLQNGNGSGINFSTVNTSFLSSSKYPRHEFKFFGDIKIALELKKMCALLSGLCGDDNATALVSLFLELYADTKNQKVKNQIVYILIGAIEGINPDLLGEGLVTALIENVLEATLERYTMCNYSYFFDTLFSLVSELFGKLCVKVPLDTLNVVLPKVLYPLLELLGEGMMNKNSKTLEAIWVALNSISQRMYSKKYEEGITLLINQNMDYIVDQISRRISCSYRYPRVPFIFSALLQLTGESFLPFLDDTLNQIFRSLERREKITTRPFIFILRDIVRCFASKVPEDKEGNVKSEFKDARMGNDGDLSRDSIIHDICEHKKYKNGNEYDPTKTMNKEEKKNFLRDYFNEKSKEYKKEEENHDDDDSMEDNNDSEDATEITKKEEEKRDMPKLMMTKRILETCAHHLGSKDLSVKLAALDAISKAIVVMDNEGGNIPNADDGQVILWPLLHLCWEPLCLRLEDSDKSVSLKALDVLRVISVHSGGFLSQRISTTALPRFVERIGALTPKASEYSFMWTAKEKESILSCLINLYSVTNPTSQHSYKMTAALLPFLTDKSPRLADLATQVIMNIEKTNPDAVWLVLIKYDGKKALPSLSGFDRLPANLKKIPDGWPQPNSVSTERINKLLSALN